MDQIVAGKNNEKNNGVRSTFLTESEKSEDGDAVLFKGVVPSHIYPIRKSDSDKKQKVGVRSEPDIAEPQAIGKVSSRHDYIFVVSFEFSCYQLIH